MPMTAAEMESFVDDLYAFSGAGDWDKAEAMLTDDFVVTEAPGLPMAGKFEGRGALRELHSFVFGRLPVIELDRVRTLAGGDHAVTILSMRFADPDLPRAELCELFRFRDGKVCEIKPYYFDPAPVIAAWRPDGA